MRIYNRALSAIEVRQLATQVPIGLVAYYDFTGDASDVSGFGNNIIASGTAPVLVSDRFADTQTAYNFGGAGSFAATAPATTNVDNVTLSAWIRPATYTGGNLQFIVLNGSDSTDGYGILVDHANVACATVDSLAIHVGSVGYLCSKIVPPLNTWSHVSATRSAGIWNLTFNGAIVATSNALPPVTPTISMSIGYDANMNFISGDIDDVRVYQRAIGVNEIQALSGN
jgi:hypothetical protein